MVLTISFGRAALLTMVAKAAVMMISKRMMMIDSNYLWDVAKIERLESWLQVMRSILTMGSASPYISFKPSI